MFIMSIEKKDKAVLANSLTDLKSYYEDKNPTPEMEKLIEKICSSSGKEVLFNADERALLNVKQIQEVLSRFLGSSAHGIFPEDLRGRIFNPENSNLSQDFKVNEGKEAIAILALTSSQEQIFLEGLNDLIDTINKCEINEKSVLLIIQKFSSCGSVISKAKVDATADDITDLLDYYLKNTSFNEGTANKFNMLYELAWISNDNSLKFYAEKNINMLAGEGALLAPLSLVFQNKYPIAPTENVKINKELLDTYLVVNEIKTLNLNNLPAATKRLDQIMHNAKQSNNLEIQKEVTIARLSIYVNETSHRSDLKIAAKAYKDFLDNPSAHSINYMNVFKSSGLYNEGKRLSKILKELDPLVEKNLLLSIPSERKSHRAPIDLPKPYQNATAPQKMHRPPLEMPNLADAGKDEVENAEALKKNRATVGRFKEGLKENPGITNEEAHTKTLK